MFNEIWNNSVYQMVIINLLLFLAVWFGIFIWSKVFKKELPPFIKLLIICFLPLASLLRKGVFESGDFQVHTTWLMSFYQALKEGLIPQWSANLCGGYGCPTFIFSYQLPYYLASLFVFFGFSYVASIKLFLIFTYAFSGIFCYLFLKKLKFSQTSALFASAFYLYAPYHFITLYFRTTIGENLVFAILPLLFLTFENWKEKNNLQTALFLLIVLTALILSHQALSILIFILILFYGLLSLKNLKKVFIFLFIILLSIISSSFYWLPILYEQNYIHQINLRGNIKLVTLKELVTTPWYGGFLYQGSFGETNNCLGYVHLFILGLFFVKFTSRFLKKRTINFITIIFVLFILSIFFTLQISSWFWLNLPFLTHFQSSHRVLLISSFLLSILICWWAEQLSLKRKTKFFLGVLSTLVILSSVLNWSNRGSLAEINDESLFQELHNFGDFNLMPRTFNPNLYLENSRTKDLEILDGHATYLLLKKNFHRQKYSFYVDKNVLIKINTAYYPRWKLFIDQQNHPINFNHHLAPGLIVFTLEKGVHDVELIFTKPSAWIQF